MAVEAAEHASGGGFPPFDQIDTFPSQIFWLVVTFGALYFALANVFLPRLRQAIDDRNSVIATQVAEAAALSDRADASVKAFEAKVAEARARARETAAKAKAEADARFAAETTKVEADLAARLSVAETRIADVRAKAMGNVADIAGPLASDIAAKLGGTTAAAEARTREIVARVIEDQRVAWGFTGVKVESANADGAKPAPKGQRGES